MDKISTKKKSTVTTVGKRKELQRKGEPKGKNKKKQVGAGNQGEECN